MGTLFSLSKSATSVNLEISEIALLLFGVLLVVGLVGEYDKSERWKKYIRLFEMFVIIGVAGELVADGGIFLFSRRLQTIADLELADVTQEAGDAKTSAREAADAATLAKAQAGLAKSEADAVSKQADALTTRMEAASRQLGQFEKNIAAQGPRAKLLVKAAPELARKLAPFAGQRVGLFVCGRQGLADQETMDAWGAIANILGIDTVLGVTGAKWQLVPTNLNFTGGCGAAKALGQGVMVFVSKRASKSTMEAANVLGRGLANVLPPSPNKMPSLVDPEFSKLLVDRGFQDKNAPWVSPGLDPDLITILIGEHP